jgi:hypothetical protein
LISLILRHYENHDKYCIRSYSLYSQICNDDKPENSCHDLILHSVLEVRTFSKCGCVKQSSTNYQSHR